MTQLRATTRFGGSTSLHYVTFASPLRRDPKLISNNMAAVLAMFDGLTLVCAAAAQPGEAVEPPCRSAEAGTGTDPA